VLSTSLFAQIDKQNYKEIDSLISSGSMISNMEAIKLLKENFKADTLKSEYWIRFSQAYFNSYKFIEALNSIDKAIQIDSTDSKAYFVKAKLIMEIKKDKSRAIHLLDTAISFNKNGEFYFYRGIYNQLSDSISNAISDYDNSTKLGYEHQGLFRNYSILLLKSDMPEKALIFINKGIALNPEIPDNYKTRGEIYIFLIEPDKACMDFEKASLLGYKKVNDLRKIICTEDRSSNKNSLTGEVLFKLEKYSFAIKAFNKAIEQEKDSSRYYLNRGYCYFKLGNYEKAEQDYLKALTLPKPTLDILYDDLSLLYYKLNNFSKSIEYSTKRIELNPENYVPYIDRGLCYRKLKKYKLAEKDFNESLKIKPDFFRAFGYRAFLFLEQGQFQKSFEDATKSIEINPEYGYGYLVLASVKQKLNITDFCSDLYNAKKYGEVEAEKAIIEFCK
jgi:tetratricopeptide (TPR) repeat protein